MSNQIITSGGTLSNATISAGDIVTINAGATGASIIVDGGQETVFGTASDTTIGQGGLLTVSGGGLAIGTIVNTGGETVVTSGGAGQATTVENGGTYVVLGDGKDVTADDRGVAIVDSGGSISHATVSSGGVLIAYPGASLSRLDIKAGGFAILTPGVKLHDAISGTGSAVSTGIAVVQSTGAIETFATSLHDAALGSGAIEFVLSGGIADGGTVAPGASQQVFAGGTASAVVLHDSVQTVNLGAIATATAVEHGAVQYVFSGGSAVATTVDTDGFALVNSGGSATGIIVNGGGIEEVDGAVHGTTLNRGGAEEVVFGGIATDTTINAGGYAYVFGTADRTHIGSGGYEVVEGNATGVTVGGGGILLDGYPDPLTNLPLDQPPTLSATTVTSGGLEVVLSGAIDSGTRVENGGTYVALPGATVKDLTLDAGATSVSTGVVVFAPPASVTLYSDLVTGLTLTSGMSDYVLSGGVASGTTIDNHALSEVDSGGTATDTVIEGGGTLAVAADGMALGTVDFTNPGGVLEIADHAHVGATVNGFAPGDTIDFGAITRGTGTVALLADNVLQVTNGTTTAAVQLDPHQDFSRSTFAVDVTNSGAAVTVTGPSSPGGASGATGVQPVDIPLYVLNFGDGYKIGIQVSLDGGATYRMYEFDTGGTGFYAAYSPSAWSAYSVVDPAPVVNTYVSGNAYATQIVSTNVTFHTTTGQTVSVDNADIGMITAAQNPGTITTQGWNTDLTGTPPIAPLQSHFYGDFGMSLRSGLGIAAVLPQIPDGLSNGFIITVGAYPNGVYGQIGDLQVGLSQADIRSFTTLIAMQGRNTLDPFPGSGQPTYNEALGTGPLTISNASSLFATLTNYIFDTGTPTMRIYQGTTITPDDLAPFLSDKKFVSSTNITATAPPASAGDDGWVLNFPSDDDSGLNQVLVGQSASSSSGGSVNTGLNAFFGYRVMFDVADGLVGFQALACFAAGTRITTPRGELAIETLQPGDVVTTLSGEARPIVWMGRRTVDCRRHPSPSAVWPVRIEAHAFGPDLPKRALLLSPDHALFLEGALIPVKYLINGTTVAQIERTRITYHHIELARHDVILAHGLPAETYLETGHRAAFTNGGSIVQAHPRFAPCGTDAGAQWEAFGYAPLTVTGPALQRAQRQLRRYADAA